MLTFFLRKKIIKLTAVFLAISFVSFCILYGAFLSQIQAVANPTTYYLLLCDMAHVEVGVEFVIITALVGEYSY